MKRAAIYARVSTEHQTSSSLETQIKTCREYCQKQGWIVVDTFQERESGGKTERPEFQRMIKKALSGEYDVIVVEKFDRFFRDDVEDRRYTRLLEQKNVFVISALEGIDPTSASGKLLRWIISDINWFQREYIKEEQLRKTKQAAQRGFWLGGKPPFGYKTVEVKDGERKRKKIEIDETQAEIVRKMFELYAHGFSIPAIARQLNEQKLFNDGKPWQPSTLYDIIRNPKYLGVYVWNRKRRPYEQDRDEVVAEGMIPAIITGELAEKVKERLEKEQGKTRYQRHFWLLNGLLVCGLCGNKLHANPHPTRSTYRCENTAHKYLAVTKDYAEKYVRAFLEQYLNSIDLDKLVEEYVDVYRIHAEIENEKRLSIIQRLQEIEVEERRIAEAVLKGIDLDLLVEKSQKLKTEKQTLMKQLHETTTEVPTREEVMERLNQLKATFQTNMPELQKEIIFKLIKEIIVYPNRILIVKMYGE